MRPTPRCRRAAERLASARPTAVNLAWALQRMLRSCSRCLRPSAPRRPGSEADAIADEDVATNQAIGRHGLQLLRELRAAPPRQR